MILRISLIILIFSLVICCQSTLAINQHSKDIAKFCESNPTAVVIGSYFIFGIWLIDEMHSEGWVTYSWERDTDINYSNPIQQNWHNKQKEKGFVWWNPHSWCFKGDD